MERSDHALNTDRRAEYHPLENKESIRLLVLAPATSQAEELQASLSLTQLDNPPSYEAISYTWGNAEHSERLWISDGYLKISPNLASALKHFRSPDTSRVLWADAICINQEDLAEKSSQVVMMGQIYQKATRVVIWLGIDDNRTDRAIEGFHYVGDAIKAENSAVESALSGQSQFPEEFELILNNPTVLISRYDTFRPVVRDVFRSYEMDCIYQNDWFTRLWIVQEVSLASKAILCYGRKELQWSCFAAVMTLYRQVADELYVRNLAACKHVWAVIETRALYHFLRTTADGLNTPSRNYVSLIESLRGQGCSDDKDKVYGFLSLQPPELAARIKPDYSKQLNEIYINYVMQSFAQGNIHALYYAGAWYREEFSGTSPIVITPGFIPTWVPDFRKTSYQENLPWLKHAAQFTKPVFGDFKFDVPNREDSLIHFGVGLRGFIMDDVIDGHAAVPSKRTMLYTAEQTGPFQVTRHFVNNCLDIFRANARGAIYPTQEPQMNAFWRLMAMDALSPKYRQRFSTGDPNSTYLPSFGPLYEKYCLREDARLVKDKVLVDLMLGAPSEFDHERVFSLEERGALLYYECLQEVVDSVCFITTGKGLIGLAPPSTRPGDVIVIIIGAHFPFIAREVPGARFLLLIGPCYIHGLMNGIASMKRDPESVGSVTFM